MTLFSNEKVFMPFREDSAGQRNPMLELSKEYYEKIGLSVELVDSDSDDFNRFQCYNDVFKKYDIEYALIINADTILSPASIHKSFEIIKNENIVVKPSFKTIHIKNMEKQFIEKLIDNDILDNFISSGSTPSFHLGTSWAINRKTWEKIGGFNETYLDSIFSNLDFAIRSSICSRLLFLNYDSYALSHALPFPRYDILDHKNRINLLNKFFLDETRNVSYFINNKINKLESDDIDQILDVDNFIKNYCLDKFIC